MEFLATAFFCLSYFSVMSAYSVNDIPGIPGVPDSRDMKVKVSRGSGMGWIHPGYILLVLLSFAFFVLLYYMIIFYKRQRADDIKLVKNMFLARY